MKNKIINLSVSIVLIVVCVFTFITNGDHSIAGAGNGKNARIKTVEEFAEVFEFINPNNKTTRMASASALDLDDDDKSKYTSATVRITNSIKAKSSSTNTKLTNGVSSKTQNLERELTCYITEKASYYESKGVSSVITYYDKDKSKELVTFDIEVVVTKKDCFVNFHEFTYATPTESGSIKSENKDKWIEMPYSFVEKMIGIDLTNREVFSAIGEMLTFLMEEGAISESDSSVSFNEKELAEILEDAGEDSIFDPEDYDISFNIDLSNPTRPSISSNTLYNSEEDYNIPKDGSTVSGTVKNKIKNEQTILIYNINNTVINWKNSYADIVIDDYDDPDVIFNIEEKKEAEK